MRRLIKHVTLVLLCAMALAWAGIPSYDLSQYKTINNQWQRCSFTFSLNEESKDRRDYSIDTMDVQVYDEYLLSNGFGISYHLYRNTPLYQTSHDIGYNQSIYWQKEISRTLDNEANRIFFFYPKMSYTGINRWYGKKQQFVECDLSASMRNSYRNFINIGDSLQADNTTNSNDVLIYVPLKTGMGRIETVTDAYHAVNILQELINQESIRSNVTPEEITQFADFISELKTRQFFDNRLEHIKELEAVDSFLVVNNYLPQKDIKYFTSLEDMWIYGDNFSRYSGSRISLVIQPGYSFHSYYSEYSAYDPIHTYLYRDTVIFADVGVEYRYDRPISLKWQYHLDIDLKTGRADYRMLDHTYNSDPIEENYTVPSSRGEILNELSYYPDTRTHLALEHVIKYAYISGRYDETDVQIMEGGHYLYTSLTGSLSYYISPKLILTAYCGLYNTYNNYEKSLSYDFYPNIAGNYDLNVYTHSTNNNYFRTQFSASISYSIF